MRCASLGLLCLALTLSAWPSAAGQVPQTSPPPKPVTTPPAGKPRPAAPPAASKLALTIMVTALDGRTIPEAVVKATGPVDREATTDPSGLVTLTNLAPGTYRVRFEHPGFTTFEREFSVAAGKPLRASASLTPAPPPPPPPKPEPVAAPPAPSPAPGN
jgi:hypothetical protein